MKYLVLHVNYKILILGIIIICISLKGSFVSSKLKSVAIINCAKEKAARHELCRQRLREILLFLLILRPITSA